MGLIMQEGKFVSRAEVARTDTPSSTQTWRPVPHIDVIEAVTEVVKAHDWTIEGEKFGLASEGRKLFGVMEISSSSSPEWHRCIGIRNSHDKSFAVGLSAGIVVCVCTNLAFGGTTVVKRRHTSGIVLAELIDRAVASLEDDFDRFVYLAGQIEKAINTGIFRPVESCMNCAECAYGSRCKAAHRKAG